MIRIEIKTDNEAFTGRLGDELASILRDLATFMELKAGPMYDGRTLRDSNGNTVGKVTVS
jgi:hypothetical protein